MAEVTGSQDVEESGISMVELLKEEEERQLDAAAVLGAADDTKCTYDQGYVKRQALYACMTCCSVDSGRLAGVCLACSYHCHEDHELIELYTKRNFRCDCGNSKFPHNACKLLKDKLPENPENGYNHNFSGTYCTCQRPYPDPEDTTDDEMIQCCICEDWYHGRHQGGSVPPGDDYVEMICGQCLAKHDFLAPYMGLAVAVVKAEESKCVVDVEKSTGKNPQNGSSSPVKDKQERTEHKDAEEAKEKDKKDVEEAKEKDNKDAEEAKEKDKKDAEEAKEKDNEAKEKDNMDAEEAKENDNMKIQVIGTEKISGCKLNDLKKQDLPSGAVFLPYLWRKQLCTCDECKAKYEARGVLFLLDDEDPVSFYEESGKSHHRNPGADVQRELEALSSLDRVTRTEMVHEYNTLSSSLREYLRKFAENKKVVRDEDIREFFSQLEANKKQRPGSSIQLFCK
ncbi:putative E3 ubiquitin-protein ligase UBR7 isoform X2 [Homarus americanus]|uniref:putative E3 ubiquitin-protein ligase UBR7 isoform X2 n=1 Tax=Homarus americanus TaxID=6706 RepID=UPI001C46BAF8|nr:putative E3 ubiquitin-protein ligase UBR7 isoform X2 [Homarus americanus]